MINLNGKRVLVMGLGLHGGGLGVTRWLLKQGARVTVTDLRSADVLKPTLEQLGNAQVEFVLGEHREADIETADLIVRNPGVTFASRKLLKMSESRIPLAVEPVPRPTGHAL